MRKPKVTVVPAKGVPMSPEQLAASGTEHGHQAALMQWVALEGQDLYENLKWIYAVPNGGDRQAHVGASMAAEGVKRGVPDLCLPVPVGRYAGLYIEMKIPSRERELNGGLSERQVDWCDFLSGQHYAVAVCYGWESAKKTIRCYYERRGFVGFDGPVFVNKLCMARWLEQGWA